MFRSRGFSSLHIWFEEFSATDSEDAGHLYSFGLGDNFTLGHGDSLTKTSPTRVDWVGTTAFADVAIGSDGSFAVSVGGLGYAWGLNGFGQTCQGHTTIVARPTVVGMLWARRLASVSTSASGRTVFWLDGPFAWRVVSLSSGGLVVGLRPKLLRLPDAVRRSNSPLSCSCDIPQLSPHFCWS